MPLVPTLGLGFFSRIFLILICYICHGSSALSIYVCERVTMPMFGCLYVCIVWRVPVVWRKQVEKECCGKEVKVEFEKLYNFIRAKAGQNCHMKL